MNMYKLIVGVLLAAETCFGAIAYVRDATGTASSGTQVTITIIAPAAGNSLILTYGGNTAATVSSVTGGGVTWGLLKAGVVNKAQEIWCGYNSSGSGTTVTVNTAATITAADADVAEFSGLSATCTGDQSSEKDNANSNNPNTQSITTTNANDLIVATYSLVTVRTLNSGPTNSFIALGTPTANRFQAAYIIVSSTGAYTTSWTLAGNSAWIALAAGIQAATVAGKGRLPLLGVGGG